jgi:shikimate dehydrogenase
MHITGWTMVCGIIGDPIEHSLSPAMQNAAFAELNLDYVYVPLRLPRGAAAMGAEAMRALGLRGLNVTVPHKVDIMGFLDSIDPQARRIGAVNTIVNERGRLVGYNTDAAGFMQGLASHNIGVSKADVVMIGAGGAARAVAFSLSEGGANITILNRDTERAESLAREVSAAEGPVVSHGALTDAELESRLPGATLLVNATSIGMHPAVEVSPCPRHLLRRDLAVYDIVYNPRETLLLRDAAECGAVAVNGVEMLVGQGARAFELWTGLPAPVALMRAVVTEELARAAH